MKYYKSPIVLFAIDYERMSKIDPARIVAGSTTNNILRDFSMTLGIMLKHKRNIKDYFYEVLHSFLSLCADRMFPFDDMMQSSYVTEWTKRFQNYGKETQHES